MKRTLGVVYGPGSASALQIADATGADCELVWVVDSSAELVATMGAILSRLGTVVDLAGRSRDEAIDEVGRLGVDGIVAFSDGELALAAEIAARLGLGFDAPAVTSRFLDKYEQRAVLRDRGVVVPRIVAIRARSSAREVAELAASVEFPAVLKPRGGSGSRDTYHLEGPETLARLFGSPSDGSFDVAQDYVLEEYLEDRDPPGQQDFGDYCSVESIAVDGAVRHLAVTGKFPLAAPYRETGNFLPSRLTAAEHEEVLALAAEAASALGVEHGALHTEIKMTPAGPRIIEVNARVAGGGIGDLFAMTYGDSLLRIAALAAVGVDLPALTARRGGGVVYQLFVQPPVGARRLVGIEGLDAINALPGVAQLSVNRRVGDDLDWRHGSQGYLLSVRGEVPDHERLRQLRNQVNETLVTTYE
jgi:hypothetical protein